MVLEIVLSITLLFVGIGILMIIHACVVGRAFRGADARPGFTTGHGGSGGLSTEDIRGLPWMEYNGSSGCPAVECTVCLEMLRQGDRCRILAGCGHCFHADCIDSWLRKTAVCPVCRAGIGGGSAQDRVSLEG